MIDAIGALPIDMDATVMGALPLTASKAVAAARIDAAAENFEAMFATQMLKPMFDTVPVNATFGGGNGEEVMRTFLLQEYGKMIAKKGLLGIASQVKQEMIRAQESAKNSGGKPAPANIESYQTPSKAKGEDYVSH